MQRFLKLGFYLRHFSMSILLERIFDPLFAAYARLYSWIFFDRHIRLVGKAWAKVHPSTILRIRDSKIIVENGTAEIGYDPGFNRKGNCRLDLVDSTLRLIGDVSIVRPGSLIWASGAMIVIKNGTIINPGVSIIAGRGVEIGEHCRIAAGVIIMDNDLHRHSTGDENPVRVCKEVKIGNHCWIGFNAMIMKGVTIGDGSIIAAGSIVTKNVMERTLVAVVPARVIRENVVWEA